MGHVSDSGHRYDAPGEIFDKRASRKMRLLDATAQPSQLIYTYVNTTAAGLVARPQHMPGLVLDFAHGKQGGVWVRNPGVYFDDKDQLFLQITPPPLLLREFGGDVDGLVHHMECLAEDAIRAMKRARRRPLIGAQRESDTLVGRCSAGMLGTCAEGITQCIGIGTECQPIVPLSDEGCDPLDNSCDGSVDEGEFCDSDTVKALGRLRMRDVRHIGGSPAPGFLDAARPGGARSLAAARLSCWVAGPPPQR